MFTNDHFDSAKRKQESIQSKIFKKPHALADATHAHATQFLEKVANRNETACEKGCSYCCHQPATVFAFEAIRIAEVIKNDARTIEKMKERVKGLRGKSVRDNINNKTACPLLDGEGQCSVYENRPLTCRLAHSFSVKRCRMAFQGDRFKVEIPVSLELQSGVSGIIEAAFEGLPKLGVDGGMYELCSAVLAVLGDGDAAKKWASGSREVFSGCIRDDT